MSEPVAWCPLLWRANGGRTDDKGQPIGNRDEVVRGSCWKAADCDECTYLHKELENIPRQRWGWVCSECILELKKATKISIPGFYHSGPCQNPTCKRPYKRHDGNTTIIIDPEEERQDRYSILLQLVII